MKSLSLFIGIVILGLSVQTAFSVSTSTVTCLNPQGKIIAQHNSGVHGIIGNQERFEGKDTVYESSQSEVLQCFCPVSGDGIQSNWVKASKYTSDEQKVLSHQGWIYINNGKPWGLSDESYFAKNTSYKCSDNSNQGTSVSKSSDNILGTQLASTGNLSLLFQALGLGMIFLLLGLKLKKA